jgi:hypothetical protein
VLPASRKGLETPLNPPPIHVLEREEGREPEATRGTFGATGPGTGEGDIQPSLSQPAVT